ncbi:hypothetical protein BN938_1860 [Mucinivorans hirudinis]|uniref:Fimbrillin family protein n=1 Tax=Mucinivorans hirudinis TaxID=1433126 RepID=A0A060R8T0_9BACT|nr:hypothetical protein BN938_1860 [Mucinivorans hirudinis]
MTMKKIGLLYALFTLLLLGGCTNNMLENIDDSPTNRDGSIAFRTNATLTRGTPQENLDAYENLNLIAYSHTGNYADGKSLYRQTVLNNTNSAWDYTPHMFWPDGRNLSFLAYAIESTIAYATESGKEGVYVKDNGNGVAPTIEYIVPTDVKKQPDLIVTALLNPEKANDIILPMKHALSCVSFCATSPDPTSKVKSITLKDVYRSGSLDLDSEGIVWTGLGNQGVTAFNPGVKADESLKKDPSVNYNYLMEKDGYLMMIPQTLTNATIDVVYWKGTAGSERTINYTLPTNIEWKAGLKYIYSFDEVDHEGVVTYYEKYSDGSNESIGLYYFNSTELKNTIKNESELGAYTIIDAGYGLLVPLEVWTINQSAKLLMGVGNNELKETLACDGIVPPGAESVSFNGEAKECVLYPMTQNNYPFGRVNSADKGGIQPSHTNTPAAIKAKFSTGLSFKTYGYCLPHYARGVYDKPSASPTTHYIRTPIQMRNISYQTGKVGDAGLTEFKTYVQEFSNMDYIGAANSTIRGNDVGATADFNDAIVRGLFKGTFDGKKQYSSGDRTSATIKNLKITTENVDKWEAIWYAYYVALFEWVDYASTVSDLTNVGCALSQNVINNAINAAMYVGLNDGGKLDNLVNNAKVINKATGVTSRTGGIVAYSGSAGGGEVSNCTNMADITGTMVVGGIAAYNNYKGKITNCTNGSRTIKPTINSEYIRYDDEKYPIPRVGGIVGLQQCGTFPKDPPPLTPIISGCTNYGTIIATYNVYSNTKYYAGGIVGENDWNWLYTDPTTEATAFGEVIKCTNYGDISGYGDIAQGVGGIAGANNGKVRESQSTGSITATGKATAGGVVGYNTNIVEDCLYYNTGGAIPIIATGYAGGIVGHNTGYNTKEASGSAYVNRCIYLAHSPINKSPEEGAVAGYAPIVGYVPEYLIKNAAGEANLSNNKVPFYTVENCFFLSGLGYNDFGGSNPQALYEPIPDIKTITQFPYGRFPMGINRLTTNYFSLLPFMTFWGTQGWKKTTTYPYLTADITGMPTVSAGNGNYLPYDIVNSIVLQKANTSASYDLGDRTIPGVIRVELFNIGAANLGSLNSITLTFGTLTFAAMPASTYAGILIKAPQGWNIAITGGTGEIGVYGDATNGRYVFLTNDKTATSITMTKL